MALVSENFSSLVDLDPVLTEIFYQHYNQHPPKRGLIFNTLTSNKAKETDQRLGSFSDPVPFDGTVVYETPKSDYQIVYAHTALVKGFQIERAMMDDMQYDGIFDSAAQMGTVFSRKQEKDAASVFNNAFSSSYLGYDSKALCANDHPQSQTDSTSVDNNLTLALTADNLETAILQMQDFGDDKGEEITIMPDTLLVPRALRKTALEIAGSPLKPNSMDNNINVHAGMNVIVWDYLTDTNAWFVVDSVMAKRYLKWYDRVTPEFAAEDSFDTLIRKFRGYMRYSYGWSDFRWVIGSNPS